MLKPASDIHTPRLILVASTIEHLRIELETPERLGEALGAEVPAGWPPGMYDRDAMQFFLEKTIEGGEESVGWHAWYAIRRATDDAAALLVASGGYFGPPAADGTIEIGYSVVSEERKKGYATEVVNALVQRAIGDSRVRRVAAEVHESNLASLAVLAHCGFARVGPGRDEGHWRFELDRAVDINAVDRA